MGRGRRRVGERKEESCRADLLERFEWPAGVVDYPMVIVGEIPVTDTEVDKDSFYISIDAAGNKARDGASDWTVVDLIEQLVAEALADDRHRRPVLDLNEPDLVRPIRHHVDPLTRQTDPHHLYLVGLILVWFEAGTDMDVVIDAGEVVAMVADPGVPHRYIAADQVRVLWEW